MKNLSELLAQVKEEGERAERGPLKLVMIRPTKEELSRFWKSVNRSGDDECWTWLGPFNDRGYGRFSARNKRFMAHRVSLAVHGQPVPIHQEVDHLCKNVKCVNPKHLRLVSQFVNWESSRNLPRINKEKEFCVRGHKFDEKNTLINKRGHRHCKACTKQREMSRKEEIRNSLFENYKLKIKNAVLAEIVEKVIEQRNHYHAVCYRDFEPAEEDDSLRKRNAELDAIVAKGMGEK